MTLGLLLCLGSFQQANAQEFAETPDVGEVIELIAQNPPESTSAASEDDVPVAQLAEGAAQLISFASKASAALCPVVNSCSRGGCGILTGENALTDEQYEQMYQLKMKKKDEMGPVKVEYKKHKRHLKDLMTREELDVKEIKKLQGKIADLKRDMYAMKFDYKLQMAQVLTSAQRAELRKAMIKGKMWRKHSGRDMLRYWMKKRMGDWKKK